MKVDRKRIGQQAEALAIAYLKKQGYLIREKNFRKNWGEIDIIAEKKGVLIFVEVKSLAKASNFGDPWNKVNYFKAKKIKRAAELFLIEKKYPEEQNWQIDVIGISFDPHSQKASLSHLKNCVW